jgi:hypothetical protein
VSTCSSGRLPARIAELKKDLYACEWFRGGQYIADPDGFDDWFPSHLRINLPPALNSPVRLNPRAISVQLPDTMSSREFDRAFDAEVRKGALDLWVRSREGQRHCAALGVDPAIAQRFTPYPFGAAARRSPVTEIVSFRKHCDPDRLIAIADPRPIGGYISRVKNRKRSRRMFDGQCRLRALRLEEPFEVALDVTQGVGEHLHLRTNLGDVHFIYPLLTYAAFRGYVSKRPQKI